MAFEFTFSKLKVEDIPKLIEIGLKFYLVNESRLKQKGSTADHDDKLLELLQEAKNFMTLTVTEK